MNEKDNEEFIDEWAIILKLRYHAERYRMNGESHKATDLEAEADGLEDMLEDWRVHKAPTKLYLLTRINDAGHDCMRELVVRAQGKEEARKMAVAQGQDEGPEEWTDPLRSTCVELTSEGESGPICIDVLEG